MKMEGLVKIFIQRKGRLIYTACGPNIVTTAGKNLTAQLMDGTSTARPTHFGFGSGSAPASEADVALVTEYAYGGYARKATGAATRIGNELTFSNAAAVYTHAGGQAVFNEVGLFNAASAGTLFARFLSSLFTFANGDTMVLSWTLRVG